MSETLHSIPTPAVDEPVVGIALGSGSARGWSHIGVLQELEAIGIRPQVVAGSSMGALVGAAYAGHNLQALEAWAVSLRRHKYLRLIDWGMPGGGLVQGGRLMESLAAYLPDGEMAALPTPFGAVATDLVTGREVWLREGPVREAVRASIALPGLFSPVQQGERWLLDGALVNPVPVSLCRALGAQVVIGVNPFGDRMARVANRRRRGAPGNGLLSPEADAVPPAAVDAAPVGRLRRVGGGLFPRRGERRPRPRPERDPGVIEVLIGALNIMQERITRSRMAGDPPDVLIAPRTAHINLLEFNRAEEAIAEGRRAVRRLLPTLQEVIGG